MNRGGLALALSVSLALAGCASAPDAPIGQDVAPPGHSAPSNAPTGIELPTLAAHSSLITVGLNQDGTIEVPPLDKPEQAAYFAYGPAPGQVGPALVVAHVNGGGRPGFFSRLRALKVGDPVLVDVPNGPPVAFRVTSTRLVAKDAFPWAEATAPTPDPELVLLTCGGKLDTKIHSYESNVEVRAVKA